MKQDWYCSGCGARGTVTIPRGVDVQSGVQRLTKAHADKSVICNGLNGFAKIRVRNCTPKEWRATIHRDNKKRAAEDTTHDGD